MTHADLPAALQSAKDSLLKHGLLLHSDLRFPNLVRIVAGETVHGSWWGHPKAHLIFQVAGSLTKDPEALLTKLVSGKETYVHRKLWSEFLSVATAKDSWQLNALPDSARFLLEEVESKGEVRTDQLVQEVKIDLKGLGDAARHLERRLLVYGRDVHTQRGFHVKLLRSWRRWMLTVNLKPETLNVVDARKSLEARVEELNREFVAAGTLLWRAASK